MDAELRAYLDEMHREIKEGQDRALNRIEALEKEVAGLRLWRDNFENGVKELLAESIKRDAQRGRRDT